MLEVRIGLFANLAWYLNDISGVQFLLFSFPSGRTMGHTSAAYWMLKERRREETRREID